MKKSFKQVLVGIIALCMTASIVGCGKEKSIDDLTEKDINQALAEYDDDSSKKSKESETDEVELEEINPFEKLNVSFIGTIPRSEIEYTGQAPKVTYTSSIESGMKNGDVITITAELSNPSDEDKYVLTETEREYTVEGLSTYIEKLEDIPKETMDKMDEVYQISYASYMANSGTDANLSTLNMELLGNYMCYAKNPIENSPNLIYFVYKISIEFEDIGLQEYYWCAYYENVIALPDGMISADYENLNMGSMNFDYLTSGGYYVNACGDLDTLFHKNITTLIDRYNYENTVN